MEIDDYGSNENTIKGKYEYVKLQETAEKKLIQSASKYVKSFVVLSAVMLALILIVALVAAGAEVVPILGTLLSYEVTFITLFICAIDVFCLFDIVRKIYRLRNVYKFDLRAAQEKLENSNVFIEIPYNDFHKFDNIFTIVIFYLKHIKEYEPYESDET